MKPGNVSILKPWDTRSECSINVTSKSSSIYQNLSPFFLGPVSLYNGQTSQNVENAWQFSKVYTVHHDYLDDQPTEEYFMWATLGWNDERAHRYPMGKGAVPMYSWWDGQKLDYVKARRQIYVPLYKQAVLEYHPRLLDAMCDLVSEGINLVIHDFDAYDHHVLGMSLNDVLEDPTRKMGHGFVLAMMIEEYLNG